MHPQPSGDVTGLGTARQFAAGMSAAFAGQSDHTGQFVASLRQQGVDGAVVAAAEAAQQSSDEAAAAWARADQVLAGHGQVAAAYAANPGAGSREFNVDEQATTAAPTTAVGAPHPSAPAQPPLPDPLRLAGRFQLGPDEQFGGSGSAKDDEGALMLAAAVDTSDGRVIHVGVPIHDEDKKAWKGAHAPAQETTTSRDEDGEEVNGGDVDEDEYDEDETVTVDTNSDVTVIIGADDAARLPDQVEDVIAKAAAADKTYRQYARRADRLYDERQQLEAKRFGETDAAEKIRLDGSDAQHAKFQQRRWANVEACVERLGPDDRARYDELQRQIDDAGRDCFEPGRDEQAANVCGLTVEEYQELIALEKHWRSRTPAERQRQEELTHAGRKPPLLAEQAAIVYGVTVEEVRELEALAEVGTPRPAGPYRRATGRTPEQQARYEQLCTSPRGAAGATPAQTATLRGRFWQYQDVHHADRVEWTSERRQQAELESRARELGPADAARLAEVVAEYREVNDRCEELGGEVTAATEVPGRNGATLVVEAVQREEEGGVDYKVDCKPAGAADDWSTGDVYDPYRTTAGGLRKAAKMLAGLAGPADGGR